MLHLKSKVGTFSMDGTNSQSSLFHNVIFVFTWATKTECFKTHDFVQSFLETLCRINDLRKNVD